MNINTNGVLVLTSNKMASKSELSEGLIPECEECFKSRRRLESNCLFETLTNLHESSMNGGGFNSYRKFVKELEKCVGKPPHDHNVL